MSVLLECQPGDEIVCIMGFHAAPAGEPFSWAIGREFHVGDRLRLVGSNLDPHFKDRPNGWQVIFETDDGVQFAATQTYFVTDECWLGIEKHFSQVNQRAVALMTLTQEY